MPTPQIYIEDYVLSFLKQKKTESTTTTPVKLALYGITDTPKTLDQLTDPTPKSIYIYGAAALEETRSIEEIGDEYFPAYQFLGYVNVRNNGGKTISKYNVFYEENTVMQDYLLYHYMSPYSAFHSPSESPLCLTNETNTQPSQENLKHPTIKIVKSRKSFKKGRQK